jgi:hypothetical protein
MGKIMKLIWIKPDKKIKPCYITNKMGAYIISNKPDHQAVKPV